jgi:hypothetical protein
MSDSIFNKRITVSSEVLVQELDGELVLLNLNRGTYFGLDEVGYQIWKQITQCTSGEDAFVALEAQYDVEPQKLRNDMIDLIQQLDEHGLVELNDLEVA